MVHRFSIANIVMVYLLGVIVVSVTCGRGASIVASILSVAAFDFFFVPPELTFAVSDSQYLITFGVMLIVALVSSNLTHRIREQAELARSRERRTAALYSMSRELAAARTEEEVIAAGTRSLRETFDAGVAILLPGEESQLSVAPSDKTAFQIEDVDQGAAQWTFDHRQLAGRGTATLPAASGVYFPLFASQGNVGVVGLKPRDDEPFSANQIHQIETFVNQLALALERARLIRETQQAQLRTETERLRNALLTSVSHDLRTPLAVITGAAGTLLESGPKLDDPTRRSLAESIVEEGARLNQIISNLVFATRLEAGAVEPKKDWIAVDEIVGAALRRMRERLRARALKTYLGSDLPLVRADGVLLELVIVNLLENAIQYTPGGSPIEISAWKREGSIVIEVADHGPGLSSGDAGRVFERFYRGRGGRGASGLGLGLYICRGIVEAHGGRIWSENRATGGASFLLSLPLEGPAPPTPRESADEAAGEPASPPAEKA
jgi:two-component system sensor histidine kinase KdpD